MHAEARAPLPLAAPVLRPCDMTVRVTQSYKNRTGTSYRELQST